MRFKIDENLPIEVAALLVQAGHSATTVYDEALDGAVDDQLALACQRENRTLLTPDLDFADIRAYPPKDYSGLVVLRLARQDKNSALAAIERLLQSFQTQPLIGKLWIVDERRVRIRS